MLVRDYFISFPLRTKKFKSFEHWIEVYNMCLNKKHLTVDGLKKVREITKIINNDMNIP